MCERCLLITAPRMSRRARKSPASVDGGPGRKTRLTADHEDCTLPTLGMSFALKFVHSPLWRRFRASSPWAAAPSAAADGRTARNISPRASTEAPARASSPMARRCRRAADNIWSATPYTVAGKTYVPSERKYAAVGLASWYGDAFHGRRTANGEIYDRERHHGRASHHAAAELCARHQSAQPAIRSSCASTIAAPITAAASWIFPPAPPRRWTTRRSAPPRSRWNMSAAPRMAGSDDHKLLATLRMDGEPAQLDDLRLSPTRRRRAARASAAAAAPDRDSQRMALEEQIAPSAKAFAAAAAAKATPNRRRRCRPSASRWRSGCGVRRSLPHNPPLPPQRPLRPRHAFPAPTSRFPSAPLS